MEAIQNKIIGLLKVLSGRFPQMTFMYGYDASVPQHIVEVQPKALYESDEYMIAESDAVCEFYEAFPSEGLLFTSGNPYIRVTEPLFVAYRKQIIPVHLIIEALNQPIAVESHMPSPTVSVGEPLRSVYYMNTINTGPSRMARATFGKQAVEVGSHMTVAGEYNYAMGA